MTRRTRRLVPQGLLLATGAAALVLVAACQGGPQAAAPAGSSQSLSTAPSTTIVPPPPTTPTSTVAETPAQAQVPPAQPKIPAGPGRGECNSANLRLSVARLGAATGHFYQSVQFTNTGSAPCVLMNFPGVSYVTGDNGTQVGAPAVRDGAPGGGVTIAPGQVASAQLEMTDVGVFDASSCQPTPVRGLRVYPPDNTAALYVDDPGTGCAGNPPSPQLRVQTIKPGPGHAQ